MIASLLPPPVAAVESFGDPAEPPPLFPEEERAIARAVESRRREFATVRHCARQALAALGGPRVPLLPGERGAPGWPDGFLGSMTHCRGYRAAAVGRVGAGGVVGVGIDAEPNEPLRDAGVVQLIALPEEREMLARLAAAHPEVAWERLLFSAKESVYKVWYPLTAKWLDFEEARLTIDPGARTFEAELLVPGPVVDGTKIQRFAGRWVAREGLLVTAISLSRGLPE
ncbi:4'-phosphopantetheinyl transferase superfamily protein [Streptomyces sp. 3MP-14]|uniref:4'-phosphopantetheinyl transferase superfamily protein n=1 Tax=Streptomyces mimosae TaxID=2586635 RepID=A0A5N6AGC2_9ACTN|nr:MULTISPECIES: 4'-phosphopantetheinyl transferase superfamily protein [Streptomyces]KAB8167295.1 4'-phosphopantetheinyl transferase superfamily protein [Streptomyces mimosae]KAB8177238.1 4'-phosphopantetheinyl transferase superfamily protein [Streptomyces sp. 3MP-14]